MPQMTQLKSRTFANKEADIMFFGNIIYITYDGDELRESYTVLNLT